MALQKRIPVSEETWRTLGEKKQAGQTYDNLMKKLIKEANRHELAEKLRKAQKGEGEWIPLEKTQGEA